MIKKWMCIALIVCLMLSVCGCGNSIPEMTAEQQTMVTEYAAALLLKYDENYEPMLLNDEDLAAEKEIQKRIEEENARKEALLAEAEAAKKDEAEEGTESIEDSEEKVEIVDVAGFLELNGVSVSCTGVEFLDSYPQSGDELFLAVTASEGCKLAVIHLDIVNNGSEDAVLDLFEKDARFKVSFNGGSYHSTMMSLLEDDFSMYAGTIYPGQKAETVLLVDLKEEECGSVSNLNLYIKYNGQSVKTAVYP